MEVKKLKINPDFKSHKIAKSVIYKLKKYLKPKSSVLDIGAGDGCLLGLISKTFKNVNVFGIDPEPKSKKIKKAGIEKLPFPDQSIDLVVCTDVIEHLTDSQLHKGVKEISRVLKEGGRAIITTVVNENFNRQLCLCPSCSKVFHKIGHQQIFTPKELVQFFPPNNLKVIETFNFNLTLFAKYPTLIRLAERLNFHKLFSGEIRYRLKKDFLLVVQKEVNHKDCPICGAQNGRIERKIDGYYLLRCMKCSFVYSNLSSEEIEKENFSYDGKAIKKYKNTQTKFDIVWFSELAKRVNSRFKQDSTKRVLDIGCGNGILLNEFIKLGWETFGLDPSPWSVCFAKKYNFKLYRKVIGEEKLPREYFDAIVCTSTLEHIEEPKKFISQILPLLKSKGVLYFSGMPNYNSLAVILGFSDFSKNAPPQHVSFFKRQIFKTLVSNNGYKISVRSYGFPGLYGFYRKIKIIRRSGGRSSGNRNSLLARFSVLVNYYSGRLFGLGDKLEVIIEKK